MNSDLFNIKRKADRYKEVLSNTINYRKAWVEELNQKILDHLNYLMGQIELEASVEVRSDIDNLEAIVLNLGTVQSGMSQRVSDTFQRHLIKHNGSLVYQQLFNGKIVVLIQYPAIENYGEPRPPKQIAIYRPEEIKEPFITRHVEELLSEVTLWEDYDDDEPSQQRIGFQLNFGQDEQA